MEQQQSDTAATPAPPTDLDSATAAAPSLPRAPLGAPCSGDEYAAIAAAARAAGAAAARAGGAPLRTLVDGVVADFSSRLPRQQGVEGSLQATTTDPHWALAAAGCAALLGEVMAGAASVRACASPAAPPPTDLEPALDAVVNSALDALASPAVWCLPLDEDDSTTPLAARGAAAALARASAEAMGTLLSSRSHGALRGATMRRGLLPLLDARGRRVPAVASGAAAALAVAAAADGRPSVRALVVSHADYVVDGVCARMRGSGGRADVMAGAASLCAAALRATGAAPDLLPLLAEPVRAAVRGLAPGARRRAPTVIAPLLDALAELCVAAGADAAAVAADEAAVCAAAEAAFEAANPPTADDADDSTPGAGVAYFEGRVGARLEQGRLAVDTPPTLPERPRPEWDAAATRRARAAAAAAIADAAADVAAPVLQAASLALVPAAERALGVALTALVQATAVADADAGDRCVAPRRAPAPPPPPTPTLLPAVHRAWRPAVAALADPRGPVAAAGARVVALLAHIGGASFIARRFADDAWPRLALLLARGSAAEGATDVAPGAARAARLAALGCVAAAADAVAPVARARRRLLLCPCWRMVNPRTCVLQLQMPCWRWLSWMRTRCGVRWRLWQRWA